MALFTSKAWNACEYCRKRKRSCDRLLPQCTACSAKGIDCDYSPLRSSSTFPAGYFLDYHAFQKKWNRLPPIDFSLAPSVADSLGDPEIILTSYLEKVHWWMPIISKSRILNASHNAANKPTTEMRLLYLAMKVVLWHPVNASSDPKTRAYIVVKDSMSEAISAGVLTLRLLQAQLLLTMYEIGHAIYPAAYLSIGACARYGVALGVERYLLPDVLDSDTEDVVVEEGRRAWWAILILDRCMQLGNPTRLLLTPDPTAECVLPADDATFDRGDVTGKRFTISDAPDIEMGMLARMSQAAFLLGRVYRHGKNPPIIAMDREAEFWQLDRTVRALLNLSYVEGHVRRMAVCGQTDICFSALIALHDPVATRNDQAHVDFTLNLLRPIVDSMSWDTKIFLNGTFPVKVEDASPLLLSWAYQAAKISVRLSDRYGNDYLGPLMQMREKLMIMARRWKAGDAYLQLLEPQLVK